MEENIEIAKQAPSYLETLAANPYFLIGFIVVLVFVLIALKFFVFPSDKEYKYDPTKE